MSDKRYFIGLDNGITGSATILDESKNVLLHAPMPTKRELSYTKTKQYISRLNVDEFKKYLRILPNYTNCVCGLERPMVMPGRFKATMSAMRCLEATLIALEDLKVSYFYLDSRQWQKVLLPQGVSGPELKTAALDIARRMYPNVKVTKDTADSICIAEFLRQEKY